MPRTDWSIRTLMYYDTIGSIVPQSFFYEPEKYDPFMLEIIKSELIIPINPMDVIDHPLEISHPFIQYINSLKLEIEKRRMFFNMEKNHKISTNKFNLNGPRIHHSKFDSEIFYQLEHLGLAVRENEEWYIVEQKTANELMSYLASIIGKKLNYLPVTDLEIKRVPFMDKSKKIYKSENKNKIRREIILKELIPFPNEVNLSNLKRFKEKHHDLLERFKNRVELIVFNHHIEEGTLFFDETIKELTLSKEEIYAKMNETKLGKILFGTVCGVIGGVITGITTGTASSLVGSLSALPSFANAIHSALQIENIENIENNSGMKYLALVDKKLTRNK